MRMLLEMKCRVESTTELSSPYHFTFDQKDVTLVPLSNEERRNAVAEITIRKRIPEDAQFEATMMPPAPGKTEGELVVRGAEGIEDELRADLQFLESL